ncbi:PREDICTED: serine/threonine-protein phosphatase 6 regulatory ankyrin repeat subunit A-like [Wasmannia auropunctata]|uniref:serine/threonine-protein phosphatase 6 regulatory ankyrin repeat subunit A-like n=1 Tax=Wasmannia auropunctata TaxID=64793 RepID=UPI0005EED468|nr:PREDICTED: serine/threonine-protein phosphatase 6 regulatory ankyrin repeat subunit A-like [Wasmannia auropunctata]
MTITADVMRLPSVPSASMKRNDDFADTEIAWAALASTLNTFKDLHEKPPLLQAIFHGNVKAVCTLLSQKEGVNWQDKEHSLLHAAAYRGDTVFVELLLLNGAAVNNKDKNWLTPLHRACCWDNYNVVDILLRYKVDVNARDRNWQTPLHVAAANNAVQCVEFLMPHLIV